MIKEIITETAIVQLVEDNVVRILVNDRAQLDRDTIMEINHAKKQLTGDERYVVIFIPGKKAGINREGRVASASKEVYRNAIAKAIIVRSATDKLIGTFFINMNKPPAPTKLFTSEKKALEWLQKMKKGFNDV